MKYLLGLHGAKCYEEVKYKNQAWLLPSSTLQLREDNGHEQ